MPGAFKQSLVSTDWLAQNIYDDGLRIVDSTWFLPAMKRSGSAEFEAGHIPGAQFWDIDSIADPQSSLPHMLPPALDFSSAMKSLGIIDATQVILYDSHGLMTAARPWWMLRYFGHDDVAVLDGGLPKWRAEGRPEETGPASAPSVKGRFTTRPRPQLLRGIGEVQAMLDSGGEQVLDARAAGRFTGAQPEPRPNCRSGHMPGALNLPFDQLLDADSKCVLAPEALRAAFDKAGIDLTQPVTTSCGSGVTACVLALGLHLIGHDQVAVYDGSWSEWGTRDDTPVEK